jgi:hypothetical protein
MSPSRGWAVVAVCGFIAACSWGLGFHGLGVYLAALQVGVTIGPGLVGLLRDVTGAMPSPSAWWRSWMVSPALSCCGASFDSPAPTR